MSLATLLQLIIALIFIYLIVSLVVSELQEQIASLAEFRAKNLKQAIKIFMGDHITTKLYSRSAPKSLFSSFTQSTNQKSEGPSYIDPKVFAESLIICINQELDPEEKLLLEDKILGETDGIIKKLKSNQKTIDDLKPLQEKKQSLQKTK